MAQTLRPYQSAAVHAVFDAIDDGYKRILYTMVTGAGKTTTFAELCRVFLEHFEDHRILILAHRRELITQAYDRVKEHCGLAIHEIGVEMAQYTAPSTARIIVGSVQTCLRETRPADFVPTVIITDESHRSASLSYRRVYERFNVGKDGGAILIGCTATAKRSDRSALYAEKIDGTPVMLEDKKKGGKRPASAEECVFEKHVFDFGMMDAVEGGYLVPVLGHVVETDTDLDSVETDTDGDFKEGQLQKAVDNAARTIEAISAWETIAKDRPTLVFCAGVEHAHHAAELWRQAGYKAVALDGKTEEYDRNLALRQFQNGEIQVICNMGLFTEGTDLPTCASVVHLRPTKSWNLYVQMTGRGLRVLPRVLDGLDTNAERLEAIRQSAKPDCIVLDVVDNYKKCGELCSVPSILDLPIKLDLEGHSLTEAKQLLDEFKEVKDSVIGECPVTFTRLAARLHEVNIMRNSGAATVQAWKASDTGYRYTSVPPGFAVALTQESADQFRLVVTDTIAKQEIYNRVGYPRGEMREYLDRAAEAAHKSIEKVQKERAQVRATTRRGTFDALSDKQKKVLWHAGYRTANGRLDEARIDCLTLPQAKAIIATQAKRYAAQRAMEETAA